METFQIVLGDELRAVRKRKKWTRRDLQRRLPFDVSLQTLATWELGTRHMSAERLVLVCDVLGELAEELLARVRKRLEDLANPELSLDITAAARTTQDNLAPVRAWAQCRLRDSPGGLPVVSLRIPVLNSLAKLCDTNTLDLTHQLTRAGLIRPGKVCADLRKAGTPTTQGKVPIS